jgi:hypothetical protein
MIINKQGIYIELKGRHKSITLPYKENEKFTFIIKNDSTALIQKIYQGKKKALTEYKISSIYDTAFIKSTLHVDGKRKTVLKKIIIQKVY